MTDAPARHAPLGARLSLDSEHWLQPVDEREAGEPDETAFLLPDGYIVFADGEVARMIGESDELEDFEGMLVVPVEVVAARPSEPGTAQALWAEAVHREYISPPNKH